MDESSWHLDKKVPLALLMALVVQFAGMMMFVGDIKSQGEDNNRRILVLESQRVSERLAALEVQMTDSKLFLIRIESKLDGISRDQRQEGGKR